jgi:serine/threonine protein kinase
MYVITEAGGAAWERAKESQDVFIAPEVVRRGKVLFLSLPHPLGLSYFSFPTSQFVPSSDIWSLGVLIYSLLTSKVDLSEVTRSNHSNVPRRGRPLLPGYFFKSTTEFEYCDDHENVDVQMLNPLFEEYSLFIDLYFECTELDPSSRPSLSDIRSSLQVPNMANHPISIF